MNAQNIEKKPVVKKESKNKIRVEFDRTPLKDRLKAKFLSLFFLQKLTIWVFRLVLMIGISYVVLYPFLSKITQSFMTIDDFRDTTVLLIPKHLTLDTYRAIISELGYVEALTNTFTLSLITALLQTLICCFIGYGFAKFKFKGRNLLFAMVILTMVVPHHTIRIAMRSHFRFFDILGIVKFLKGGGIELFGFNIMDLGEGVRKIFSSINILPDMIGKMEVTAEGINVLNSFVPFIILSITALGFKNGLYIFMLRQFFRGVPDELEESAYMDGSGVFKTFFRIILPLSIPMMITVFLFAFCWQWTDNFYTDLFYQTTNEKLFFGRSSPYGLVGVPTSLIPPLVDIPKYETAIRNTCGLMIIGPLVILYIFCQNFLVQGIEQSGLAN